MRRFIVMGGMLAAGVLSGCATGAPTREALVAETPQCAAHRFDIYFAEGQARLTPDAAGFLPHPPLTFGPPAPI